MSMKKTLQSKRFADDIVLFNEKAIQMEKYLKSLKSESLKVSLKYARERQMHGKPCQQ